MLVIHGNDDAVRPHAGGAALAEVTGGDLVTLEGSGHAPHARDPVKVNLLLRDFVDPPPPGSLGPGQAPAPPRPLHLLADRARARPARRRDREGAAAPGARPRDRLARPEPRHASARGGGGADPPVERAAGQRVAPHRVRVGRARPPLLPGLAPDGRDPGRQLHGLPRPRPRARLRPVDRRRGVGARLLPAREPRAEAGRLRVADRLRGLAADGGRRRPRGLPDRRLQRRDDRAHRALPAPARPGAVRRQPRRRRAGVVRRRPADDRRLDRGALRLHRLHHRLRSGQFADRTPPAGRARLRRRRARVRGHRRRLGRRRPPAAAGDRRLPGGQAARARPADDRRLRPAHRPARRCRRHPGSRS